MSEEAPRRSRKGIPSIAPRRRFRVALRGWVDEGWIAALDPASFSSTDRITQIEVLADQAALRGILNRLWDLNLDVISVTEIARSTARKGGR